MRGSASPAIMIMRGSAFPHPTLCEALEFDQLGVDAAAGEQFGVSALLGDAALLDDQNTVGVVYGAQAVGYDYRRTSLEQGGEGLLHEFLALGVEGRGGLVEDQYLGVAQHGAGDAYALALAAREFRAAVADIGIVALGARP